MIFKASPKNDERPLGKYMQWSTVWYNEEQRCEKRWALFIIHKSKSKLKDHKTAPVFEAKMLSITI